MSSSLKRHDESKKIKGKMKLEQLKLKEKIREIYPKVLKIFSIKYHKILELSAIDEILEKFDATLTNFGKSE